MATYAPNALGEPTQVGTYATGISYHANGSVAGFTYGNGTVHSQTLNTRQLPLRRRDVRSGVDHLDLSYIYDANANVTKIADATSGAPDDRDLVYDALNRMIEADVTKFDQTYAYDPLDNLRQAVFGGTLTFTYSYASASNRLTQLLMQDPTGSVTHSYGYDARGNMTSRTNGHTHSYDRANRMLWATTPAGTETYRYDGHGRRTSIIRPGGTTTQLYSRDGSFLYERAPNGVVTKHIHLGGRQIARQVSSTRTYTHTDTLGSLLRRTDTAGAEIERTRYEPYGSTNTDIYVQGPGFTGHVTDAATKLSYMQQRYYDNTAMRFVSVDPVAPSTGDGGNFNRYWYANANPYKYTDPDGEFAIGFAVGFGIDVGMQLFSGTPISQIDMGSAFAAGLVSAVIPGLGNLGKVGFQSTRTIASSVKAIGTISNKAANTVNRAMKNSAAIARNTGRISVATAEVGKAAVVAGVHQAVKHEAQSVAPEVTVADSISAMSSKGTNSPLGLKIEGANVYPAGKEPEFKGK